MVLLIFYTSILIFNMFMRTKGKRGLTGLGFLIMFIAILLSVAFAALTLLQTHTALWRRQEQTQKEQTRNLQHPIIIEMVKAWDGDSDTRIDRLSIVVRLHWGDDPINFNRTVIVVDARGINCTSLDYGPDAEENCSYTVTYLRQGSKWEEDYLHSGDMAELRFTGTNLLGHVADPEAKFTFIPSHGLPTELKVEIPRRIYPQNMEIWPIAD